MASQKALTHTNPCTTFVVSFLICFFPKPVMFAPTLRAIKQRATGRTNCRSSSGACLKIPIRPQSQNFGCKMRITRRATKSSPSSACAFFARNFGIRFEREFLDRLRSRIHKLFSKGLFWSAQAPCRSLQNPRALNLFQPVKEQFLLISYAK